MADRQEKINWIAPTPRSRRYGANEEPEITVNYKPIYTGPKKKSPPVYTLLANKAFFNKFYTDTPEKASISVAEYGGKIVINPNPRKNSKQFKFTKSRHISDINLVKIILENVMPGFNKKEIHKVKLAVKRFGTHDDQFLHQLTLAN